ncbi:MAG: mercuric transporter MerT family protein, partial [Fibrobacterales bacterium]
MKTSKQLMGTGIATAIAASFCCITPLLAFISGATGVASSLSWLEPFRPYFMGITLLVLSVSWYQKLKARKTGTIACDCDDGTKTSFLQSKVFLGLVTLFAISMLSLPYYGNVLYPNTDKPASTVVVP